MIIFNWLAVALALPGFLLALGLTAVWEGSDGVATFLFAALTASIDVWVRFRDRKASVARRLFIPWRGGHVFFVPLWIPGVFLTFALFIGGLKALFS